MNPYKRKKIAFIIPSLAGGGAERVVSIIASNLNKHIFESYLLVLQKDEIVYDIKNCTVIELKVNRIRESIFKILKVVKKIQPDIIFSTLTYQNTYLGLFRFLFPANIKFIARESTLPSINHDKYLLSDLFSIIAKVAYSNFDAFVCQSNDMKNDVIQLFGIDKSKITLIFNPVDVPNLLDIKCHSEKPTLISVSMFRKEKGFDRMFRILSQLDIDFEFILVGDGAERGAIVTLIEKYNLTHKVQLVGKTKNPYLYLQNANLFLQTSYFEGMPNALIEAQSVGLPAIAFDCPGGTKDIIIDGITGFLITDGDEKDFLLKIKEILSKETDNQAITNYIANKFGKEHIVKEYEHLFLSMLNQN